MGRKDGRYLSELESYYKFITYLMPSRLQGTVWSLLRVDATNLLRFLAEKEAQGRKYTIFQIVVASLMRTAAGYPQLNRFIYGHKIYARKDYVIAFAVDVGAKTVFRKIWLDPADTLPMIAQKVEEIVSSARQNPHDSLDDSMDMLMKLPSWLAGFILRLYPWMVEKGIFPKKFVDEDILYSSALVSNLGKFNISAPFHHLYEWGNTSVFLTVGTMQKVPMVMDDDSIAAAWGIEFGFTVDERVCDGKTLASALELFKTGLEDPWTLETPPTQVIRE